MSEIAERERRWKLAERWTLTRLRCLECGVVGKLISYFCQNTHPEGIEVKISTKRRFIQNLVPTIGPRHVFCQWSQ